MTDRPPQSMDQVIRADGRYPPEAYAFLHEGMTLAMQHAYGEQTGPTRRRHVTGRQICLALRDLARQRWGLLAETVLRRWNICETMDFGQMVYLLIQHGFMHRSEEDSIEDFRDVYRFTDVFGDSEDLDIRE